MSSGDFGSIRNRVRHSVLCSVFAVAAAIVALSPASSSAATEDQPLKLSKDGFCVVKGAKTNKHKSTEILLGECAADSALKFHFTEQGYIQTGELCFDPQEEGRFWLHTCEPHPGKVWQFADGKLYGPRYEKCVGIDGEGIGAALVMADCKKAPEFAPLTETKPLAELMGISIKDLPGLGAEQVTVVSEDKTRIVGRIQFAGSPAAAVIFRSPGGKANALALIPDGLSLANLIADLKNNPLNDTTFTDMVLTVVLNDAAAQGIDVRKLPDPFAEAISKANRYKKEIDLKPGLTLYGRVQPGRSGLSKELSSFGIKDKELTVEAVLSPLLVTVDHHDQNKIDKFFSKNAKAMVPQTRVALGVQSLKLPGIDSFVEFEAPQVIFASKSHPALAGAMTISLPGNDLSMQGYVQVDKNKALTIAGKSTAVWKKAFGLPFLDMSEISIQGRADSKGKQIKMVLAAKSSLAGQVVESITNLQVGPKGIDDFNIALKGGIDVSRVDGFNQIPGIKEFDIQNLSIGRYASYGEVKWKRFGVTGRTVLMENGGAFTAMLRVDGIKVGTLLPAAPAPFKDIAFGRSVMFLSSKDIDNKRVSELPVAAQAMLADVVEDGNEMAPIFNGVGIVASLSEKDLPGPMRKIMAEQMDVFGGLKGPLVVSGAIGDLFGKVPSLTVAAKLPSYQLPKGQPLAKVVSFDKVGTEFFLRLVTASTIFQFGVAGNMDVTVPHIGNPMEADELSFRGELIGNVDLVSVAGSVKAAGSMRGTWRKPFGINDNMSYTDPAIVVGVDTEGSIEFGVGGDVEIKARGGRKTIKGSADFLANINFSSTIPLPKKLGIRATASEIDLFTYLDFIEAAMRGILVGPMAEQVLTGLPQAERNVALKLQSQLRDADVSLQSILQIDKLPFPIVRFRDLEMMFATPGAIIPGREDRIDTIGAVIAGKAEMELQGKAQRLGQTENRLTLKDGLKLITEIKGQNLGPLKFTDSHFTAVASLSEVPRLEMKGAVKLFGSSSDVDVKINPVVVSITSNQDYGSLLNYRLNAFAGVKDISTFEDLSKADFRINSTLTSDPKAWIEKEGVGAVRAALGAVGGAMRKATADLDIAKAEVDKLNGTIDAMRRQVREERRTATDGLAAAQREVNTLRNEMKRIANVRSRRERDIRSCNQNIRICTIWIFGCRKYETIPDLFARGRCELENTPPRLDIVRYTGEIIALEAARATAELALETVKQGASILPVDADPRVAGPMAARDIAQLTLDGAKLAVSGITEFGKLLDRGADVLRVPEAFKMERGIIKGSLKEAVRGKPVVLDLDFTSFGNRLTERIAFSLSDPKFNAEQLGVIALGIVTKKILEDVRSLNIVPHVVVAELEKVYTEQRAAMQAQVDAALSSSGGVQTNANAFTQSLSQDIGESRRERELTQKSQNERWQQTRSLIAKSRNAAIQKAVDAFGEGAQFVTISAEDETTSQRLCLEATTEKNHRGASKMIFSACAKKPSQTFVIDREGQVRGIGGRCLDYQEKDQLWLYTCTGHPGMKWEIRDFKLYNPHTDKCLRGVGSKIKAGTPAEIDRCFNRSAWAYGVDYTLLSLEFKSEHNGERLCLEVMEQTNKRGANWARFQPCGGGRDQTFLLRDDDTVLSLEGKCLDYQEDNQVFAYTCTGNQGMRWVIDRNRLQNKSTKKCIRGIDSVIRAGSEAVLDRCFERSATANHGM